LWPRRWRSFFRFSLAAFRLALCLAAFRCGWHATSLLWRLPLNALALRSFLSAARFIRRSSTT